MSDLTDLQLLEGYEESGEIRHFDDLVRRHISKVRSMIYPMVMNDADADEITQEVFLRVMKGIANFKRKAQFSSWLYMITMNTTRNFLRSRKRNPVSHHEEIPEMTDTGGDPAAAMMNKEFSAEIESALSALSPVLRSAIVLVAIEGMSTSEAAAVDGCLTATMYWRVHEARRILKKRLSVEV